jgi:ribosomal protein L7/L12
MAEITKEQVVDFLSNMPVIQLAEMIKTLEDKWGVKAAPVAVAGVAGPAAAAAPAGAAATATAAAADTPHFSSSNLASSAACSTVSFERSSTIFARSVMVEFLPV